MKPITRIVVVSIILYASWLLLSGIYKPFLMSVGLIVSVAVPVLLNRFGLLDEEALPLHLLFRNIGYSFWLAGEIIKSAFNVARIVLDPKLPISPTMVTFRPSQKTDLGRAIHGNSITLTPGTITVGISSSENTLQVHGITKEGALGCINSEMNERVSKVEGAE